MSNYDYIKLTDAVFKAFPDLLGFRYSDDKFYVSFVDRELTFVLTKCGNVWIAQSSMVCAAIRKTPEETLVAAIKLAMTG